MRRFTILALAAALASALFAIPVFAANGGADAEITVVHGIPGDALGLDKELPVDVCLSDGSDLLGSVPFMGTNAGDPLAVPAGTYSVEILLDETPATHCEGTAVLAADLTVESGGRYTAIAHLTEGLAPGAADLLDLGIDLTVIENDFSRIGEWRDRVTLGHFADAPMVDVYQGPAKGMDNKFMRELLADVPNGAAASADFEFGRRLFGLAISPSEGPGEIAVGPARLWLAPKAATFVFAVGSLTEGEGSPFGLGSFDLITYTQR